jgi:hypothetical protein
MSNFDIDGFNLLYQDVSFELQCAAVLHELDEQLGLQARVLVDGYSAHAEINLNDGYRLIIRPAFPVFNGVNSWFKWTEVKHPTSGGLITFSQVRCVAELQLFDPEAPENRSLISFGVEAQNLQQVVHKALTKISQHCGLRLVALPQTQLNKSIK